MSYAQLEIEVVRWAEARGIVKNSTPLAQAIKTTEEVAELLAALSRGDTDEAKDAYGDILVTLIIGCACLDVNLTNCLETAYEQIKHRRGYLGADGVFIKETPAQALKRKLA